MNLINGVRRFIEWLFKAITTREDAPPVQAPLHEVWEDKLRRRAVPRHRGKDDPPPGHWKACHPSTAHIFKAILACPQGHVMTLTGHTIHPDGKVSPSVVCAHLECTFHEFVVLTEWETITPR